MTVLCIFLDRKPDRGNRLKPIQGWIEREGEMKLSDLKGVRMIFVTHKIYRFDGMGFNDIRGQKKHLNWPFLSKQPIIADVKKNSSRRMIP